jgi:hypothetical protein
MRTPRPTPGALIPSGLYLKWADEAMEEAATIDRDEGVGRGALLAEAQVWATMALAAATRERRR